MINRTSVATGCLMLFCAPVWAQQKEQTTDQPSSQQPPTQTPGVSPQQTPPFPRLGETTDAPKIPQQPTLAATTAPVAGLNPVLSIPSPSPALGNDLRIRVREQERHYLEQSAAAKNAFNLRQAEERKEFEATPVEGLFENRRRTQEFRGAQTKRRVEFNKQQEKKRLASEWRFP